jgi:hypothetical protein
VRWCGRVNPQFTQIGVDPMDKVNVVDVVDEFVHSVHNVDKVHQGLLNLRYFAPAQRQPTMRFNLQTSSQRLLVRVLPRCTCFC